MDRAIFKCDYIRYTLECIIGGHVPETQTLIDIQRKNSVTASKDSYKKGIRFLKYLIITILKAIMKKLIFWN